MNLFEMFKSPTRKKSIIKSTVSLKKRDILHIKRIDSTLRFEDGVKIISLRSHEAASLT